MFEISKRCRINPLILVVSLLMFSCNKDNEQPPISIYGSYVVTAIQTDGQFDFFNTGTVSSDFRKQLEEEQAYDFNSNLLSLISGSPDLVNMTLIKPTVLTTLPDNIPLIRYDNSAITLTVEKEAGNKDFAIITANTLTEEIGEIEEMSMLNQLQINVLVPQRIYDFNTQAWVNTIVTYTFNRLYV